MMLATVDKATRPPEVSPEARALLDDLVPVRDTLRGFYQTVLIGFGVLGLVGAVALFIKHDPANMLGLCGAVLLLLSLGAILEGLVPKWKLGPKGPLFAGLADKVDVRISTQPVTLTLSEADLATATKLREAGRSPDDIVRAVYPAYDQLGEHEQEALRRMLEQALRS
jgi:hypothetical protein